MTGSPAPAPEEGYVSSPAASTPPASASGDFWGRLREHKIAQWTLAYAAAGYTLLHCVEMVSEAMEWPHLVARILTLVLGLGFPIVITLAWYHGAKALKRVTGPELLIIATLLAIAGSVLWAFSRSGEHAVETSPNKVAASGSAARSVTPAAPRTAIAVMPFANLTGDASKDYLGDGMAEEVINMLTKVPGLQVPARTSSFAYKGRNTDIRQIGRDLDVGAVLEGSVRSAGNRIRITAQLINAQTGLHLWSQTYDRTFTDLFRLQDDLATAIVQALQVKLNGPAPSSVIQAPPTRNVEAYDLYLQGYSVMLRASEPSLHLALDLYQQALALDPTFARALAARSRARLMFLVRGYPLANARDDAERDAKQALALDPSLDMAYQALANVSALRANWLQAEASYRAALDADTNEPDIHSGYAMVVLAPTGRLQQAHAEVMKAYQLAPASPNHVGIVGSLSIYMGLDADAVKFGQLAQALGSQSNGARTSLAPVLLLRDGHYSEAGDSAAASLSPAVRAAGGADVIRLVYTALGEPTKKAAARQALQNLVRTLGPSHIDIGAQREFVMDFALLGALDPAYELANDYLDEFFRSGTGGGVAWLFLWLPEMRAFRQDARFQEFATRLNLMDYWKKYGAPDDCELKDGRLKCH
jgi:TolB-like protein/Tfp pilus assembly protein PilF